MYYIKFGSVFLYKHMFIKNYENIPQEIDLFEGIYTVKIKFVLVH